MNDKPTRKYQATVPKNTRMVGQILDRGWLALSQHGFSVGNIREVFLAVGCFQFPIPVARELEINADFVMALPDNGRDDLSEEYPKGGTAYFFD